MTPDQKSLVDLADQILRVRTTNERLAEVETSETRIDERLWAELAAAGLVGIAVPAEYGGAGLGLTEICLLLEQHGRRLALLPLWETAIAAYVVARSGNDEVCATWLPGVAAGTNRLALVADLGGGSSPVPAGMAAQAAVVASGDRVSLVPLAGVARVPVETTTHALSADLDVASAHGQPLAVDADWVRDVARVGLAAGQLGNTDEGVREAASYLTSREQFGRPLATFQAVSQQLGDGYCDVQAMRATLWQAVWALEQVATREGTDARREVDVAAWWACDAGVRVQTVVQHLHGGIGADTTYPVHRRLLWALQTDALLGGASRQLARLGPALVS
jgi:alkylation response protein AidB-like acyl-CoA dehydrogenase